MCAGKRKLSGIVIKTSAGPTDRAVAKLAILRKSGRDVIRIGGPLHVLQVTADASDAERRKLIAGVTARAGDGGVLAG